MWGILPIFMAFLEVPHESRANPDGGWDAFKIVVQDFRFVPALIHVLQFMAIFVPSTLIVVIAFSLMLDLNPGKWKKFLRLTYILPASVSGAVAVLVWYAMLQPTFSPLKGPLSFFGITDSAQVFQTKNLPLILAIMAFFAIAGYWIVIQYGSLQSISTEIIEAARIDGCSGLQLALRIKLPAIKKYIVYMSILLFAGGLQIFVEPTHE
jgi:multiple sugar transport system permease protein